MAISEWGFHVLEWITVVLFAIGAITILSNLPKLLGMIVDRFSTSSTSPDKIMDPQIIQRLEKEKIEKQKQEHKDIERNLSRNTWNY